MDDHNSRQQIDELADLYLTGVIDEDKQAQAPADEANPVTGPAPIKLSPKTGTDTTTSTPPTPAPPESALQEQNEPDDRHPVLRLTENADDTGQAETRDSYETAMTPAVNPATNTSGSIDETQAPDEDAPQAVLEAVVLGNLPGMSGPWLTQYAQLIAQSEGPVALLHVGEDAIDLELVEPRAEAEPAPLSTAAVRIPPMRGNKTGLVGLLDALTRSESAPTRTVLVRMETHDNAQSLSRLAAIDDWTLLCGSDDASVAGAGQQLSTIVRADPRLADRNIGLMVMGSDEPAARNAADRVARDLEHDLMSRVEFIGHLKRMQPVHVRELGSFPDPVGVWPQLVAWFDSLEPPAPTQVLETVVHAPAIETKTPTTPRPAPASTASQTAASTPTPPRTNPNPRPRLSPAAAKLAATASRPQPQPAFRPTPPTPAPQPRRSQPQPAPAANTAKPKPQPAPPAAEPRTRSETQTPSVSTPTRPAPQPRVLAPQPELDLVALLAQGPAALDDPAALDARIPDQPDTQLAIDRLGVVHVLMQQVAEDTASNDPRQAVMQLIEAGRWVREHLELLALTQRDRDFTDHEPTLHLLTDRADLATQLVGKLAGQVKLHLLQQVSLGRESGWFCTPLG